MYRKRHIEKAVSTLAKMFGAVLFAGPRQVGKTTMLKEITKDIRYTTLDDLIVRTVVQEQSGTFLRTILRLFSLTKYKKHSNFLNR